MEFDLATSLAPPATRVQPVLNLALQCEGETIELLGLVHKRRFRQWTAFGCPSLSRLLRLETSF